MTEKAINDILPEIRTRIDINNKDFILSSKISEKQMFYNPKEEEQIKKLTNLLQQKNFKDIKERLDSQGLRTGFACLFSGAPGTGKTETVYQIARKTGRDLLQVDASKIKSMWVGGSEKNIKALFASYRDYVKNSETAPILFFNEADAIIGKRFEFTANSRAVDQMENTIQNIILQEMETLEGILIATTNMTKNMDTAFKRRFLYKIEFAKPEIQARKLIWKSMLKNISDREAYTLASDFDLSGGQIENITRKRMIDSALYGKEPDFSEITAYCREELMGRKEERHIGFAV